MKILFVGVFKYGSTNISQYNSLKRQGHEVNQYDYREMRQLSGQSVMEGDLVSKVDQGNIDLVFFSKCNGMTSWVVDECNKNAKTALWYMDPLNSNFNQELIEKIKKCNYTFCALQKPYEEAKKYSDNVYFLQEGFDPDSDYPVVSDTENKPYKVTFIGNLTGERKKYHQEIAFKNITNCFGREHPYAVGLTKINLNFVQNESGCSDRVYKILAAKGFLLTQPWPGMEKDFVPDKDFVVFNGMGDLINKINIYSSHKADFIRMKIAEQGYRTVQKFSRDNWAKRIIKIVEGK